MGEARRKQEIDWAGKPRPRDERCPACGGKRLAMILREQLTTFEAKSDYQCCLDCRALWEPFPASYARDPVAAEPCDNCAFRPGSPEQQDPEAWKQLMVSLKPGGDEYGWLDSGRFYCHKGVPIDQEKGPGNFLFPKTPLMMDGEPVLNGDGTPKMIEDIKRMRVCSGFLRMVWAYRAKAEKEAG
jgi:hypothetical protein